MLRRRMLWLSFLAVGATAFGLGLSACGGHSSDHPPVRTRAAPPPVKRTSAPNQVLEPPAGLTAQQRATFTAGAAVAGEAGCEGCHEIGPHGNNGPGPVLTHIGSVLKPAAIAAQLRNPSAPMPSFAGLARTSPRKFRELVQFLAMLR